VSLEIVANLERRGAHSGFNLYHLRMIMPRDRMSRMRAIRHLIPTIAFSLRAMTILSMKADCSLGLFPTSATLCRPLILRCRKRG